MKFVRTLSLGLLVFTYGAFAAVDSSLLSLVPPDAKIISGIQVEQSKASRFGQYVLGQMSLDDAGIKKFIADTGFDPRRDLSEIVLATTGADKTQQVLVIGRGVFNPARIATTATTSGATVASYNGVQIISDKNHNADYSVGFFDAGTAVMGNTESVKAAIDRRGAGAKLDAATLNKAHALAAVNDAWFISTVPVTDFFSGKIGDPNMSQAMGGNLLQAVKSASGGVKFTAAGVTIAGEALTRSDQDATALADVIRFIAGLVQQSKTDDPRAQQAATLLNSLQLTTQASTLKISLSIPQEMVEKLFMPQQKKAVKATKTTASL